ncbi:Tyrosine recombinase XerC [Collinsella aerofaciens]|uniref:Tyrosine recombinase XerC n=1 Tax=Collinsella aerofaciens TaxID=74426 RepID=A0A5K1IZE0_9ACTN|nr:Tyrosine recombinase XerC [Collinsella aerofaciens]
MRHIRELFGDMPLGALRPDEIKRAYAEAISTGRFTEAEIRRIHVKLKQVMQDALENELIGRNPCISIKLPKPDLRVRNFLSPDELPQFTKCLLSEPMGPMTVCTMLIFHLGLRKGEALGLCWEDYDPEAMEIRIIRQYTNDKTLRAPKSEMSRRILSIDSSLAAYLNDWKMRQRSLFEQRGLRQRNSDPLVHAFSTHKDENGNLHVSITRPDGHNYSRWFRDFCVDNGYGEYANVTSQFKRNGKLHTRGTGYSGLVPHGLRHTAATALVASNVDLKTVQARMGHASASTTANFYTHAIRANDRNAAEVFESLSSKN